MVILLLALAGLAVAFGATAVATPAVRRFATDRTWHDSPDGQRKLHKVPTPSAGGLAIFAGVVAGLACVAAASALMGGPALGLHPIVYLGAIAMVAVGAYDDTRGLGFKPKLLVECVVAFALIHAGYRIDVSGLVGTDPSTAMLYSFPLTVLWIVGVINAVNLIDGVDGLAAGISAIAFASLAVVFGLAGNLPAVLVAVVVIGALTGFLMYNFNPASIFMGDSGSLFLGYGLAVFALSGQSLADSRLAPLVPAIALGLPLLDTALSMARRVAERKAIFAPDCDHIHHRMVARFPVRRAVVTLYGVAALFGAAAVAVSVSPAAQGLMFSVGTVGAALGLVAMLGYVRLPYVQPQLRLIERPGHTAAPPPPPVTTDEKSPAVPAPAAVRGSGDGAQWPASTERGNPHTWTGPGPTLRVRQE